MKALRLLFLNCVVILAVLQLRCAADEHLTLPPVRVASGERDIVVIVDGKFIIERHEICGSSVDSTASDKGKNTFELEMYGEAPAEGLVSRDQFLLLTARCSCLAVSWLFAETNDETTDDAAEDAKVDDSIDGFLCTPTDVAAESPDGVIRLTVEPDKVICTVAKSGITVKFRFWEPAQETVNIDAN
jgi:hypothetical protein